VVHCLVGQNSLYSKNYLIVEQSSSFNISTYSSASNGSGLAAWVAVVTFPDLIMCRTRFLARTENLDELPTRREGKAQRWTT
jgi:hypothetical protein